MQMSTWFVNNCKGRENVSVFYKRVEIRWRRLFILVAGGLCGGLVCVVFNCKVGNLNKYDIQ